VLAGRVRGSRSRVDILYNNAGLSLATPLRELTAAQWDRLHDVNLRAVFLLMREFVPLMGGGQASIINTASGLGLVGAPFNTAYCASKGGVVLLTKAGALELAPDIRVNVLCPGIVDTSMTQNSVAALPGGAGRALLESWMKDHPAGRMARPEEIVSAAVFLASDESSFISGASIPVDSGYTAH
jgi:NAD(P)-dependent dehydrogenase (short-subunit alcohol dehydrogenase family)